MGDDVRYIVPAPRGSSGYQPVDEIPVALARSRRVQGKLFEKHILNMGTLLHPQTGEKINVDDAFIATMQNNFDKGYCDIVQVPLAKDKNEHVENPGANLGEVVGIRKRGDKVYALLDARQDAEKFGKTYLGASAFLSTNYTDSATGKKVGPTLLHVAVTNRPYVTGLEDYTETIAASADSDGEVFVLTAAPEETVPLSKAELLAALKNEHGIDVEALQASASAAPPAPDVTTALTGAVVQALKDGGYVSLAADAGQVTMGDVTAAVVELAADNKGLRTSVAALQRQAAETEVDAYIGAGRLLPKTREAAVEMALSRRDDLEAILAPADHPYVALSAPQGVGGMDGEQRHVEDIDTEVAKLTAQHSQFFTPNGTTRR